MVPRHLATTARPLPRQLLLRSFPRHVPLRTQIRSLTQDEANDPNMTGGYINPPRENRQNRDPYGDWWDKQERRNFGEPVHEDNDLLGRLSLEEEQHITPGKAAFQIGCFVSLILALCGVVSYVYPDQPSATRTFPGGLDRELGGKGAWLAPSDDEA